MIVDLRKRDYDTRVASATTDIKAAVWQHLEACGIGVDRERRRLVHSTAHIAAELLLRGPEQSQEDL